MLINDTITSQLRGIQQTRRMNNYSNQTIRKYFLNVHCMSNGVGGGLGVA